jgi:hypothetical protein
VAWTDAWGLFLAAVHAEVLGDEKSPLAPYFPSCGGTAEADPTPVFARYLDELPKSFYDSLRHGHKRVFVPQRAQMWINPAGLFFQKRRLPYYLVQLNAGAGLDLAADLLYPQNGFDSELIAARIGLEPAPLDLERVEDRRWLTAGFMPEELADIHELDRVMELVGARRRREQNFIQLAGCAPEKTPAFLVKNVPVDDPEVGLFVFNMGTTVRMTDDDYGKFRAHMLQALRPWGDRALWLEVENVRGELYSTTYQALLHRAAGDALRDMALFRFDLRTKQIAMQKPEAIEAFLA